MRTRFWIVAVGLSAFVVFPANAQTPQQKMKAAPAETKGYDQQKSIKPFAAEPKQTGGYDQQKSIKIAP